MSVYHYLKKTSITKLMDLIVYFSICLKYFITETDFLEPNTKNIFLPS